MPSSYKRSSSHRRKNDAFSDSVTSMLPIIAGVGIPLLLAFILLFGGLRSTPGGIQDSSPSVSTGNRYTERVANEHQHALHKNHVKETAPALDGSADAETVYSHAAFLVQTHRYADAVPYLEYAAFNYRMPYAYHVLGELYIKGKGGVHKDYTKGFEMIRESAKLGHSPSFVTLGYFYEKAVGMDEVDLEEAAFWYQKAADVGDLLGMSNLAMMYRLGSGVPKDLEKSVELFQKAAAMKDGRSMFELGNAYYNGLGVKSDMTKALNWYRKAADYDDSNPSLFFNLGNMYRYGLGDEKNVTRAMIWYERAADMGHVKAAYELQDLREIN
jgi:TPR repeat protein